MESFRSIRCRLRRPQGRALRAAGAAMVLGLFVCFSTAQAADPRAATTSTAARQEAIAALPLAQLAAEDQAAVSYVLENTSIYRRMPTEVLQCDPHLFGFLLENPEILTNLWQLMQISDVRLQRTGPDTFRADDGVGTTADVKAVYRSANLQVFYAEGSYNGPLNAKPIRGRCVLLLRSQGIEETDGRYYITCRLDTFLHMERTGIELIAKTIHPLMGRAADANFTETLAFVSHLSRTCETNPTGTARMAQMLMHVQPEVRNELGTLAHQIAGQGDPESGEVVPTGHQSLAERHGWQPVAEVK